MHKPAPPELLRGMHEQLRDTVLPEVSSGAAERQLKASLHVLRRLERSWDRLPAYLAADNADLLATLGTSPVHDDAAAENERLQALLAEADAAARADGDGARLRQLAELYDRMLQREAVAWGTS